MMLPTAPSAPPRAARSVMNRLLSTACVIGIAGGLGMIASRGDAQSGFNGTHTVALGGSEVLVSGPPGTPDNINIGNVSAGIIDWTAVDPATNDFLPSGNTVNFTSSNQSNYTILNRISLPSGVPQNQQIVLNGTINSTVQGGGRGGNIWFYTPGGFIVGSSAVIDVGSLVLSSSAIPNASVTGGGNTIAFTGTTYSDSAINILSGANIQANNYLALVAPRIVQGGTIRVDGSSAFIAAEAADITINNGLFDINVTTGSGDANGIVHEATGSTGGPASLSASDVQKTYLVAVPKNQAMTMLLQGAIGYTAAAVPTDEGSAVVLSAGYGTGADGTIDAVPASAGVAGISVDRGIYSSAVTARANGAINLSAASGNLLRFDKNADFTAQGAITATAGINRTIEAVGDLTLTSGTGTSGGTVSLSASGVTGPNSNRGAITVGGVLKIDTRGNGNFGVMSPPTTGAGGIGGNITLTTLDEGIIQAVTLDADTSALGGAGLATGGNATGGNITLQSSNASRMTFTTASLKASADALNAGPPPITGGHATGGTVNVLAPAGGTSTMQLGALSIEATAQGGSASTGNGGSASGGNVLVQLDSGIHTMTSFQINAFTRAGSSFSGGFAGAAAPGTTGVDINVAGTGTSLTIAGSSPGTGYLFIDASSASTLSSIAGTALQGGTVDIAASNGGSLSMTGDLSAFASAFLDSADAGPSPPASSADAVGGTINILADGGSITARRLDLSADASTRAILLNGPQVTDPGTAYGGTITLTAQSNGAGRGSISSGACVTAIDCTFGTLSARAFGGSGAFGGDAEGGTVLVTAVQAGISDIGNLGIDVGAEAGYADQTSGNPGGDATGGDIVIQMSSGFGPANDPQMTFNALTLSANADASLLDEGNLVFNAGDGGIGIGGTIRFDLNAFSGVFTATSIDATANGRGGASAANALAAPFAFQSGSGNGGSVGFSLQSGTANITSMTLLADGTGGQAGNAQSATERSALAGSGFGGSASLLVIGGTLNATDVTLGARGTGGGPDFASASAATDGNAASGGEGTGGSTSVNFVNDGVADIDHLTLDSDGKGGIGADALLGTNSPALAFSAGSGGTGRGGTAQVRLDGGTLTTPLLDIHASGIGGQGGDNATLGDGAVAGDGVGGEASMLYASEGHIVDAANIVARGTGGIAGAARRQTGVDPVTQAPIYAYGPGTGGRGGNGSGGDALLSFVFDPTLGDLTIDNSGIGSAGADGAIGGAGGVGMGGSENLGATLDVIGSALTITGTAEILSDGRGGAGGRGFTGQGGIGGAGFGGDALVISRFGGASLDSNILNIHANGFGGAGGIGGVQGGSVIIGADGGRATGGVAQLRATQDGEIFLNGATQLHADATGGNAAVGTRGGNGGTGGEATGGAASVLLNEARLFAQSGDGIMLTASGTGGNGGNGSGDPAANFGAGGGNGGAGQGGTAGFEATTADFDIYGLSLTANGIGGTGGIGGMGGLTIPGTPGNPAAIPPIPATPDIPPQQGFFGNPGDSFGGTALVLNTDDGTMGAGTTRRISQLDITASGDFNSYNAFGGRALLTDTSSAAGGVLDLSSGNLSMASEGFTSDPANPTGIRIFSTKGTLHAYSAFLTSTGLIKLDMDGTGRLDTTEGLYASSTDGIQITHSNQAVNPNLTLSGGTIQLYAGGAITADAGSRISAIQDVFAQSYGSDISLPWVTAGRFIGLKGFNISSGSLNAGDDVAIDAGGEVALTTVRAGDDFTVQAAGPVTIGSAIASGTGDDDQDLFYNTYGFSITPNTGASNGANIVMDAGPITATSMSAAGGINLTANGVLLVGDMAAGQPVVLRATSMNIGFDTLSVDSAVADGNAIFNGGGLLRFTGTSNAANFNIGSGDIDIGAQARINASGAITLANTDNNRPSFIGGTDTSAGYSLSNAELNRLFAHDIAVTLQSVNAIGQASLGSNTPPDVFVDALSLTAGGGGNLAPDGIFSITTPGKLRVRGAVSISGFTTGGMTINANDAMEIIAGSGSIDLRGAGGALGGVLTLTSDDIIAATAQAIADVAAATTIAARNDRLSLNDGVVSDDGMLRAGTINLSVIGGVYIQNTGADASYDARRGFTASSINIDTEGSGTQIVVNGRLSTANGFVTGVPALSLVRINGVAGAVTGFAAGSTINNCLIANIASCVVNEERPLVPNTEDVIDGPVDTGSNGYANLFPTVIIELRDFGQTGFPPLIDEPVTGAGNDDLWDTNCEPGSGETCGG